MLTAFGVALLVCEDEVGGVQELLGMSAVSTERLSRKAMIN